MPLSDALAGLSAESGLSVSGGEVEPAAAAVDQKIGALLDELSELMQIVNHSAMLAKDKKPSAAVLTRLNANDATMKKLGIAKDIAVRNAQAIILKITEQGDEVDAAEFYRAMGRAAREVRHWATRSR